jgi:hypothetical protein
MGWKQQIPWDKYPWAMYAAGDKDGHWQMFRDEPLCDSWKGFWWHSIYDPKHVTEADVTEKVAYTGDWTKSLVIRPGMEQKLGKKAAKAAAKRELEREREDAEREAMLKSDEEETVEKVVDTSLEQPPKRKRGRPRKVRPEE